MKMQPRSDDYANESQGLRQETTDESLVCLTLPKLTKWFNCFVNTNLDVVLMELKMPEMGGIDAIVGDRPSHLACFSISVSAEKVTKTRKLRSCITSS